MWKTLKSIFTPQDKNTRVQVRKYTRSKFGNFMFFLFLVGFGFFSVIPLIYSVVTSFKPLDELMIFPPKLLTVARPTIENYTILPSLISGLDIPMSRYVMNSVMISLVGTVLHVLCSGMASFVLAKTDLKHKNIIFLIIQYSLLFNGYTLGIPRYLIYTWTGLIDNYLVYILPFIPSSMGVFLMKQYMDGYVPNAIIEAARIDGASWNKTFWSIVFPMVRPCVLTLVLFTFRDIWATVPGGTIFTEAYKTLPTVMSTIGAGGIARTGAAMAASVIMMIPPIAVYLVSQSSIKETMGSAGIKG